MSTIGIMVGKAKRKPEFLAEIHHKEETWALKEAAITKVVDRLIEEDAFIDSCHAVISVLEEEQTALTFTEAEVRRVMTEKGMKYRKVKHVPLGANTDRNMILRQRWVMAVINKDHKFRVYLNIDETWLGMSDFRRMKW